MFHSFFVGFKGEIPNPWDFKQLVVLYLDQGRDCSVFLRKDLSDIINKNENNNILLLLLLLILFDISQAFKKHQYIPV